MNITFISIFPDLFESFFTTTLISRAIKNKILKMDVVNPRDFCYDRHQQVDDAIYGGGAGLLMKVKPMVDAVESVIKKKRLSNKKFKIFMMSPSQTVFTQKLAHQWTKLDHIIFVCGRYEGIDERFSLYMTKKYKSKFQKISIGTFITLGGELPAMTMAEAVSRLIPGVIKEESSWQDESYNVKEGMNNLEYPQYTRPEEIFGMKVPEILLSGHHKKIEEWKNEKTKRIEN